MEALISDSSGRGDDEVFFGVMEEYVLEGVRLFHSFFSVGSLLPNVIIIMVAIFLGLFIVGAIHNQEIHHYWWGLLLAVLVGGCECGLRALRAL